MLPLITPGGKPLKAPALVPMSPLIILGPLLSMAPTAVNMAKLAATPSGGGAWPKPSSGEASSALATRNCMRVFMRVEKKGEMFFTLQISTPSSPILLHNSRKHLHHFHPLTSDVFCV